MNTRQRMASSVLILASLAISPSMADAKCFGFRDNDVRVCVDGNDNAARRRAIEVCEEVTGGACAISGYSGECRRSSSVRCYDSAGEAQRDVQSD